MPIHRLPPDVAAKIAAGEVVERPSSVVKELVENALDAGAIRVAIELLEGGIEHIRVTDNGRGIASADTEMLFQRHATSKLQSADDLERVATLGFRGEALYSIAAVSSVSVLTHHLGEDVGSLVDVRAGEAMRHVPQGAPQGTTITVSKLFADFPARRKFLKSAQTEASRVATLLGLYVLAYPEVAFSLKSDSKETLASHGTGTLRDAAATLYGADVARVLLEATSAPSDVPNAADVRVRGLISPPELSRGNRSYITLFVNRRPIQNRSLVAAVEQAYLGLLTQGRHPIAVLTVSVPPGDVDINVHPTKSEVRFRLEGAVFGAVQRAVRTTLLVQSPVPSINTPTVRQAASAPPALGATPPQPLPLTSPRIAQQPPAGERPDQSVMPPHEALPQLHVLGQMQTMYIVAEGPDGIYLIDQHAAHERVQYERLRWGAELQAPDSQGLLNPEAVELAPQQQETLALLGDLPAQYGWHLEPFGARTLLVRAMPAVLVAKGANRALTELLDAAASETAFPTWEERLAATTACHGSVRAGQALNMTEMAEMLRLLHACREPNTCPHGRPTTMHLSASQLEREFRRR
ncbi:MAG: DNA mismatch repair endonuclease MutL [Dehalococcoidia bacterium]|nr:DNA mismatch repair endonuclease MutL [Dehalococcoidia bacterium]